MKIAVQAMQPFIMIRKLQQLLSIAAQVIRKIESEADKKAELSELKGYDLKGLDVYELKQV